MTTINLRTLGRHIKNLRRARGITQELLAERSDLSPDTVRRLEHGSFAPSLTTLQKLCAGLGLELSTFFEAAELGTRNEQRELADLMAPRSARELVLVVRLVRVLLEELDAIAAEDEDEDNDL